ncbi:chlorophyll synthesis pathway protein BchC [Polymorphobacter fuscus]|uniref:Chlorophyll synthesis pathway protein BchC n=1 Tax=Sandarakinorhabdus fusca TaxID=1439888 RepID=A0A7C9GR38_9SPHN|nr:chlorophyll synthesis pathway protein BchC [Polymorphobacter fuscus]KAB7644892.1 chlorophyll synthesis pathway protein BchC [Polymorphobacter fuscus]MQT18176.1 chlorophyll synthesis pathway protein BchC [Polymorphobacter fuscus]
MDTLAVVVEAPGQVALRRLDMAPPEGDDLVIAVDFSGISMGTEKLMYNGSMPAFPGMGYPLVPGYEAVGRVVDAGPNASATSRSRIGEHVFVPGSSKFIGARGLFGGSAQTLVTGSARVLSIPEGLGESAVLLSLAATARHALAGGALPDLIIGHGVLGRLLARMAVAEGRHPTVWEINGARMDGASGYHVVAPDADDRRDYRSVYDASGDSAILDPAVAHMGHGGEIVLAGFYSDPLSFNFAPAFRRETRIRIATEFLPDDLAAVVAMVGSGRLSLDGLVTNTVPATEAATAYGRAFTDPACLKMVFDWRDMS